MQCPHGDGELRSHTAQGENNLVVSYSTCPTCSGYWMDSFAANFIKLPAGGSPAEKPSVQKTFSCPVCQKHLERATGENIPDHVMVYSCPDHHGYFFPAGQFAAFKQAQTAKISYHKLWNIPLPSVASVLLAGLLVLITFTALTRPQTITTQAQQILSSQSVIVSKETSTILVSVTTRQDAVVTIHIPSFENFSEELTTRDRRAHLLYVRDISAGEYDYTFTLVSGTKSSESEKFHFVMPQ